MALGFRFKVWVWLKALDLGLGFGELYNPTMIEKVNRLTVFGPGCSAPRARFRSVSCLFGV